MDIKILKVDEKIIIDINGIEVPGIKDYQIKSSASGETELTIKVAGIANLFDSSASLIEQT